MKTENPIPMDSPAAFELNAAVQRHARSASFPDGIFERGDPEMVIQHLGVNTRGTDYVVGDIHGMFSALERALENRGFDPACDRLLSVGDLIDRGPESERAADWLEEPWFRACRGNHEQMMLESQSDVGDPERAHLWLQNGGAWVAGQTERWIKNFARQVAALPFAMEVETQLGERIGITHAEVPLLLSWDGFLCALERESRDPGSDPVAMRSALWGRQRRHPDHAAWIRAGNEITEREYEDDIEWWGKWIQAVLNEPIMDQRGEALAACAVGHTPVKAIVAHTNIVSTDTAAYRWMRPPRNEMPMPPDALPVLTLDEIIETRMRDANAG